MGNKAAELEAECKTVLFAFEEAIGMKQATCTLVRGMYFSQPWIMGVYEKGGNLSGPFLRKQEHLMKLSCQQLFNASKLFEYFDFWQTW